MYCSILNWSTTLLYFWSDMVSCLVRQALLYRWPWDHWRGTMFGMGLSITVSVEGLTFIRQVVSDNVTLFWWYNLCLVRVLYLQTLINGQMVIFQYSINIIFYNFPEVNRHVSPLWDTNRCSMQVLKCYLLYRVRSEWDFCPMHMHVIK